MKAALAMLLIIAFVHITYTAWMSRWEYRVVYHMDCESFMYEH